MSVVVIGAAGAVGKFLIPALASHGHKIIAVDRAASLPNHIMRRVIGAETSVDVRDIGAISKLFQKYKVQTVWNLAAPLSVETAENPEMAEEVTIGGMRNVLYAMLWADVRRIVFTDSIGSFGARAPRQESTARWLTENPHQDPGSDYGRQKRGCRTLFKEFTKHGGDPRWAVLPGVLHSEASWGKGTTEYALEAIKAASRGEPYVCPIDPESLLPMIYVSDLMRGLLALQDASETALLEPESGYAIPGLSFTANELFDEIRTHVPDFRTTVQLDPTMNKFANLWPDTLSLEAPLRDLDYKPEVGLPEMVRHVLDAHAGRSLQL